MTNPDGISNKMLIAYNFLLSTAIRLNNITEWIRVNKLSPSPLKTEYMIIGHPMKAKGTNAPTGLELGKKEIKRVSNTKSLN